MSEPRSAPRCATRPFSASISVGLPRWTSCAVDEYCSAIAAASFQVASISASGSSATPSARATAAVSRTAASITDRHQRVLGHAAVPRVADRRNGVERAIERELRPQRGFDVGRRRAGNARVLEHRRQSVQIALGIAACRQRARHADHEVAAARMAHASGALHVTADVDDRRVDAPGPARRRSAPHCPRRSAGSRRGHRRAGAAPATGPLPPYPAS